MGTAGASLKLVDLMMFAAASKTLFLELVHADRREGCGAVMLAGLVVNLVDGHRCVDHLRLDYLPLDKWLDDFVHMTVGLFVSAPSATEHQGRGWTY